MGVLGVVFCGEVVVNCVVKRGGLMVVFLGLNNTPLDLNFSVENSENYAGRDDSRRRGSGEENYNSRSPSGMTTRKARATARQRQPQSQSFADSSRAAV